MLVLSSKGIAAVCEAHPKTQDSDSKMISVSLYVRFLGDAYKFAFLLHNWRRFGVNGGLLGGSFSGSVRPFGSAVGDDSVGVSGGEETATSGTATTTTTHEQKGMITMQGRKGE